MLRRWEVVSLNKWDRRPHHERFFLFKSSADSWASLAQAFTGIAGPLLGIRFYTRPRKGAK